MLVRTFEYNITMILFYLQSFVQNMKVFSFNLSVVNKSYKLRLIKELKYASKRITINVLCCNVN